jgi:hypothetical protein
MRRLWKWFCRFNEDDCTDLINEKKQATAATCARWCPDMLPDDCDQLADW